MTFISINLTSSRVLTLLLINTRVSSLVWFDFGFGETRWWIMRHNQTFKPGLDGRQERLSRRDFHSLSPLVAANEWNRDVTSFLVSCLNQAWLAFGSVWVSLWHAVLITGVNTSEVETYLYTDRATKNWLLELDTAFIFSLISTWSVKKISTEIDSNFGEWLFATHFSNHLLLPFIFGSKPTKISIDFYADVVSKYLIDSRRDFCNIPVFRI